MLLRYYKLFIFSLILFIFPFSLSNSVKAANVGEGASGNSEFINYGNHDVRIPSAVTAEMLDKKLRGGLANTGKFYMDAAKANGLDPAFLASISMHETGGTSSLLTEHNNVGGITCRDTKTKKDCVYLKDRYWQTFPSIEEGIKYKAELIKRNYVDKGLYTISQIQKKYCPDGDGNCSTTWIAGVAGMMKSFLAPSNDSSGEVTSGTGEYSNGTKVNAVYEKYFNGGDNSIKSVGVDEKTSGTQKVSSYVGNKYVTGIGLFLFKIAQVASIFMIGIMAIFWLLAFMAQSGIVIANEWLNKLSFGSLDIYDTGGFGKLSIFTGFTFFVVIIIMTGLLPKFFAFIYYYLGQFIEFLSRL